MDSPDVEVLTQTSTGWDDSPLPEYPDGTPEVTVARLRLPPGTALEIHKHPVISAGVLLRGELTLVTEDGATMRLEPGDSAAEVVDQWHYGKNEGSTTAELIVFYAGVNDIPNTIEK
ncbi:MAG: cupin domain-containing protein [Bacteroidetes bacterium SW_9_63_38]|nr:MAG: cupin domain-containing protein [Bacteroidetes bacterium SW_9_63_38]